jgi:LPXTG-site transpeptidase (sortase) family protein
MKWRRGLGALLLLIGICVAILPLLEHAYGAYSQWQLNREFDAEMRKAQGQNLHEQAGISPWESLDRFFSIRVASAEPVRGAALAVKAGPGRSVTTVSSTSRRRLARRVAQQSRHRYQRMGLARLEIPKLNMSAIVVEGTGNAQLARGPAHFIGTAHPGQPGNCAIAGHRNVFGSWFKDLNLLRPGDMITIQTPQGSYNYKVTKSRIVMSNDLSVLRPTKAATLTLVTCMVPHAKHRLVVFGQKV